MEGAAEGGGGVLEVGLVSNVLGALVGDVEFVDHAANEVVVGEGGDGGGAVCGAVVGADSNSQPALALPRAGAIVRRSCAHPTTSPASSTVCTAGGEGVGVPFYVADVGVSFTGGEF